MSIKLLLLIFYLFILYISVGHALMNHHKRYLYSINKDNDSGMIIAAKVMTLVWPIAIPAIFLSNFFSGDLVDEWAKLPKDEPKEES